MVPEGHSGSADAFYGQKWPLQPSCSLLSRFEDALSGNAPASFIADERDIQHGGRRGPRSPPVRIGEPVQSVAGGLHEGVAGGDVAEGAAGRAEVDAGSGRKRAKIRPIECCATRG